jgi:hypothetical protein
MNQEIESYGTSGSRGIREDQRIKSGRLATFSFEVDLANNSDIQALIGWALGTSTAPTDGIKFATVGARWGDSDGFTLEDCAITRLTIVGEHGQVIKVGVDATCFNDWDVDSVLSSGVPSAGTPLVIEESSFTIQGTELPVESFLIEISQGIMPVFAQNSFPVSFKATAHREVLFNFSLPSTDTTYALIDSLRDDDSGDVVVDMNGVAITGKNTYLLDATGTGMQGLAIGPVTASLRATKPDTATDEVTIAYG